MKRIPQSFRKVLNRIYGLPASISIITGRWKTGKTDFALLIAECLLELKVIDHVASNIETWESPVEFINSLDRLKYWFFEGKGRKAYLYDETIESSPRRKAMSKLNVAWIQTIPQLSKARGHLICITQEERLTESAFFNPTFCRGVWRKLGLKTAVLHSQLLREEYMISGIPRTHFKFKPYQLATFNLMDSSLRIKFLPSNLQAITLYARGLSFKQGALELGLSQPTQFRRLLQQACRTILTYLQEPSEGKALIEACKEIDKNNV